MRVGRNEAGEVITLADDDPRATGDAIGASLQQQGIYQSPDGWAIVTGSPGGQLGGAPRIILDTNGKQPPPEVLARFPMAPPQEQQGFQQQAAQYRAGEGKPVSMAQAALAAVGAYFGGQALGGLIGGGGLPAGASGAFDMGGTAGSLGPGASGSGSAVGSLVDPSWGVNARGAADTGAFDQGASSGVFGSSGQPLYNTGAGGEVAAAGLGSPAGIAAAGGSSFLPAGTTDFLKGIAPIAGPIIGGLLQGSAAKDAAAIQGQATQEAIGEQRRQFDTTRADLAPYREAGAGAVTRLSDLIGTSGNTSAPNYGDLTKKFTLADFWDDPVTKASYQAGLDLGTKALQNQAARNGTLNSGATLKALDRYATDYTGGQAAGSQARFVNDQNNTYTRAKGVADTGAGVTTTGAGIGGNTASTIGSLITGQGNAGAASSIAQGNTIGAAIGGIGNYYGQQDTLDKILANNRAAQATAGGVTGSVRY